ncbi:MAG: hypothetical protein M3277_12135 [Actinomycetota bacterium]|nr:hypothetical protein [Actinomycetota bacterium]
MNALFFADLLGVRSKWHKHGRLGAEKAFSRFKELCTSTIEDYDAGSLVDGGIESDALALKCASAEVAARFGMDFYKRAFLAATEEGDIDQRFWVRGAIIPIEEVDPLRTAESLPAPYAQIQSVTYSGPLLDAISVERSGIKGMRLLIHQELISMDLQNAVSVDFHGNRLETIIQLPYTPNPERIAEEGYQDLLWMADPAHWETLRTTMVRRLQWAVKNSEEFAQAAATQVVFHECQESIDTASPSSSSR